MTASTHRRKLSELRRARGLPNTVPIENVRARITELHALGMTNLMIAHAAGVAKATVGHIVRRNEHFVCIDIAARIYTVDHRPHPNQLTVLAIGARRRVRALNAIGWPTDYLADRLGQRARQVLNIAVGKPTMTYNLWQRIDTLYQELSGTPGPSDNSRVVAKRNGHLPPLAWEGRDIDDPRGQPDWAAAGIKLTERPLCIRNHAYTPENTYYDNRSNRQCKTCRKASNDRRRAKRIAERKAA